ncbi:MAG: hypothetical protein J6W58_07025 [Lachnospiraceae bacterium]|nr:hypothetical protein [Lachnospiraceae bacterium]MBP5746038.1 hypothetical protein [Lachnospiraceae bacterium]
MYIIAKISALNQNRPSSEFPVPLYDLIVVMTSLMSPYELSLERAYDSNGNF